MITYLIEILFLCGSVTANHLTGAPVKAQLDQVFSHFVETNEFYGAQLGILQGSRLLYAEGRGTIYGKQATPSELCPILDLSKSITAVAVLQLVEQGTINLDSKVFGSEGILWYVAPQTNDTQDPRFNDITVEHLLRHCAGWDETASPVLDPLMNKALRALGYAVPDIAQELGNEDGYLDQYEIIYYMTSQPLQYTPGERVVHSNLGYSILGRVIEEVSGLAYEDYVKENILVPSGMWHTRIGHAQTTGKQTADSKDKGKYPDKEIYQLVPPQMLDSTLGWYSNVYDIARFFTALYGASDTRLLRKATLDYALKRNPELAKHHTFKWPGLGLEVQLDGSLTLESSARALGVSVFFYKEPPFSLFGDEYLDNYLKQTNTALVFIGFTNSHKKHLYGLHDSVLSLNLNLINHNAYIRDLCDIELVSSNHQVLTKTQLDEHKLVTYTNAMRLAGYFPKWLHGYNHDGHSYFMTIFELATESIQLHFKLKKSSSKPKLYRFISSSTKGGYQVSLLQSYHSASHNNHLVHFVLMRRTPEPQITMFNLCTNADTYQTQLPNFLLEGYQVTVQSMDRYQRQPCVSYVLQMPAHAAATDSRAFVSLTLEELQQTNTEQRNQSYSVSYIDSYLEHGQTTFSAVFTQDISATNCSFTSDIRADLFVSEAYEKSGQDFLPAVAAAYTKDDVLHFAVQWVQLV